MVSMGLCQCRCGGETKTDTARFIVGHDAKHKSALIRKALEGDEAANTELAERGWLQFLDKARNSKGRKREANREVAKQDGMPLDAIRITADMDEDEIAGIIRHRRIKVRLTVKGITKEEDLEVASIRLVAEGEIDFYVCEGWVKDGPTQVMVPIPGALRTIRVEDVVGVYAA